jgi:hypothetical protein
MPNPVQPCPAPPHPKAAPTLFLAMQENFMGDDFATALAHPGGASVRNSAAIMPGTSAF